MALPIPGNRSKKKFLEVTYFFDSAAIMRAVDQASRKVLSKFGAFVRRQARQSIRPPRRKRRGDMSDLDLARWHMTGYVPFASAKPGEPPRNLTGLLRDNILFWYDPSEQSVTIGPASFGRPQDIPGILEFGGTVRPKGRKAIQIEAHPYMRPALEHELPKLERMWADSVKG